MEINSNLLEIKDYTDEGYCPVIDYNKWRVAILNYCENYCLTILNKCRNMMKLIKYLYS